MRLRLLASLPLAIMMTFMMFSSAASLVAAVERSLIESAPAPSGSEPIRLERFEMDFFWGARPGSSLGQTGERAGFGTSHVDAEANGEWDAPEAGADSDSTAHPASFVF